MQKSFVIDEQNVCANANVVADVVQCGYSTVHGHAVLLW